MLDWFKRRKLVDKIIMFAGLVFICAFFGYLIIQKRPARTYHIPKGFEGWVTIRFEKPGAPPIQLNDEGYQIFIPESGELETSSEYFDGWGRDFYYWMDNGSKELIPRAITTDRGIEGWIHEQEAAWQNLDSLLIAMPFNSDTVLWDGTEIEKQDTTVDVTSGRKVLEHFFVTTESQPFGTALPERPKSRDLW